MKLITKIQVGARVKFDTGNFSGLTGEIIEVNWDVPDSLNGYLHTVKLSNGEIGYIEKSEHVIFI